MVHTEFVFRFLITSISWDKAPIIPKSSPGVMFSNYSPLPADVGSTATGFCVPSANGHHGTGFAFGSQFTYAFLGNPTRCPSVAAPQFFSRGAQLPTPNGDLAADAMASTVSQLMSEIVTNPTGGGWFDRYGLENAAKCVGQFGTTYQTMNGARANLKLGGRDYLIQQNWVNDRKGHCAMNSSL